MDAQSEALLVGTRNWVWGLRRECQRLGYELPLSTQRARRVNVQYVLGLRSAAAAGMGGPQRVPSDVPDRGCS